MSCRGETRPTRSASSRLFSHPGIGLVHSRLSLVDLNPRSARPFWDRSGRYCLVYEAARAAIMTSALDGVSRILVVQGLRHRSAPIRVTPRCDKSPQMPPSRANVASPQGCTGKPDPACHFVRSHEPEVLRCSQTHEGGCFVPVEEIVHKERKKLP